MARKLGLAMVTVVAVAAGGWFSLGGRSADPTLPGLGAAGAQTAAIEVPDMVLGNPESPVVLTEYASFTCPHCATFHGSVFKQLKADYIDTGKIKFVYREVFFDRYGLWAAMVARCGGDMRYFGISDILYSTQGEWSASNDATAVVENLRKIGRTAGMSNEQLDVCMQDADMAQAMVAKFEKDTKADNIESTPSLVINGEKHSNMSYADLKKILDAKLAE
ncbi:MAG: DsbA family protein [Gemmobacter sp.]|nr:DsbA family protein [Gemmobacter sp.]